MDALPQRITVHETDGCPASVETPSGKGAADENFPVASCLISPRYRPVIRALYAFARAADDIADNPVLLPDEKIWRLDAFAAALRGTCLVGSGLAKAHALREAVGNVGVDIDHGLDLLVAFRQDATTSRYPDWESVMGYCAFSAAPVGRFLLALHGEDGRGAQQASDALCVALQLLNHLQDCGHDYRELDRVYIPLDILAAEGEEPAALAASVASRELRRVFDAVLDRVEDLLKRARGLSAALRNPRLAAEAGAVLASAWRLTRQLRHHDPLKRRVVVSRPELTLWIAIGALAGTFRCLGARGRGLYRRP